MSAPPFKVKALYDYHSAHNEDLDFPSGQLITVVELEGDDWYVGAYVDKSGAKKEGLFPKNFVERYEPEPPPRPNRSARQKTGGTVVKAVENTSIDTAGRGETGLEPEPVAKVVPDIKPSDTEQPPSTAREIQQPDTSVAASRPPVRTLSTKKPAPPVAEKSNSFKDRIAAFNKSAAPPIIPTKPLASAKDFIKKPFVAPPPARDAYVPPPREVLPSRLHGRGEELPLSSMAEQKRTSTDLSNLDSSEALLEEDENAPKPTSLKERIALLQKQQMEQATRHTGSGGKDRPRRPSKQRTDSYEVKCGGALEDINIVHKADDEDYQEVPDTEDSFLKAGKQTSEPEEIEGQERAFLSDGNDADQSGAGDSTEDVDATSAEVGESDKKPQLPIRALPEATSAARAGSDTSGMGGLQSTDEENGEEVVDAETRRRLELRERMAKMSGGMNMAGVFGPLGGLPSPVATSRTKKPPLTEENESATAIHNTRPIHDVSRRVPLVPLIPGTQMPSRPGASQDRSDQPNSIVEDFGRGVPASGYDAEVGDREEADNNPESPSAGKVLGRNTSLSGALYPGRSNSSRIRPDGRSESNHQSLNEPVQSPSAGSESDDEMSLNPQQTPVLEPSSNHRGFPNRERSESSYGGSAVASSPVEPKSPGPRMLSQSSLPKQSTKSGRPAQAPTSDQFNSPTTHARPPPPPPPPQNNQGSDRRMTAESLKERTGTSMSEGETEYDGDYDTDIASRASHKDALTKKDSERGIDESQNAGDVDLKASNRQSRIAPIQATQHTESRTRPPPIPSTHPVRQSMEFTRPPPPPPPPQQTTPLQPPSSFGSQGFDTVEVTTPSRQAPQLPKDHYPAAENTGTYFNDEDLYGAPIVTPAYTRVPPPPLPPPLSSPPQHTPHLNPASNPASSPHILRSLPVAESSETWGQSRQSQETSRSSHATTRASVDISRSAYDHGYMASDVDLISGGPWWTAADTFPPVFQNRRDVRIEMQEQSIANRDTNDAATKVVHVLFPDYSQTIVTAQYDTKGVGEPVVQQRHEPPPAKPRQDQLEEAYEKFGRHVSGMVVSKQNLTIGDGTAQALVHDIIKTFPSALPPIGTRAYGATVYANIANATVQQYDEIRPGDIITLRNVRLQGKHGPMHQKYSLEVGKPDHVGIVVDWDGTKKKIRAWEQGRDGKKVKIESYKLGDLRSGEVRVWRVMDRQWVGWTAT